MKILFAKKMTKQYWKLRDSERRRIDDAIAIFRRDQFAFSLHNHPLKGSMEGRRSLSAGFDLRIIFEERDEYTVVILIAVGRHEEVY